MIQLNQLWSNKRVKITENLLDEIGKRIYLKVLPDKRYAPICAYCGSSIKIHQYEKRTIRDIPLWGFEVFIESHYRKGYCPKCRKIVVEHLEFVQPGHRITNRLAHLILCLGKEMTDSAIADALQMSWNVVHKVHYEALQQRFGNMNYGNPRLLGIDEIAIKKRHHYATVIVDLETGRLLSMEPGRTKESLMEFYRKLTQKQRDGIEAVVTDAWQGFVSATEEMLPTAEIVTDYFHLVRRFNKEVMDAVRIAAYKSLDPGDITRKIIKKSKYLLYKKHDTSAKREVANLDEILKTNKDINTAYLIKDMLHAVFQAETEMDAIERFNMFITLCMESKLEPAIKFMTKLFKQYKYIINHAKYHITTSVVEGINNKIKIIKRRAYGFKNLNFFKLLSIQAFY